MYYHLQFFKKKNGFWELTKVTKRLNLPVKYEIFLVQQKMKVLLLLFLFAIFVP